MGSRLRQHAVSAALTAAAGSLLLLLCSRSSRRRSCSRSPCSPCSSCPACRRGLRRRPSPPRSRASSRCATRGGTSRTVPRRPASRCSPTGRAGAGSPRSSGPSPRSGSRAPGCCCSPSGLPHDLGHVALLFVALGAVRPAAHRSDRQPRRGARGGRRPAGRGRDGARPRDQRHHDRRRARLRGRRRGTTGGRARTSTIRAPRSWQRAGRRGRVLAGVVPFIVERPGRGGLKAQMSGPEGSLGLLSERELWARVEHGDVAAREHLVRRYLPLARQLAARYAGRGRPLEDLVQVANLGSSGGRPLPARPRRSVLQLRGPDHRRQLRRHFRDVGWALHSLAHRAGARAEDRPRDRAHLRRHRAHADGRRARRRDPGESRGRRRRPVRRPRL